MQASPRVMPKGFGYELIIIIPTYRLFTELRIYDLQGISAWHAGHYWKAQLEPESSTISQACWPPITDSGGKAKPRQWLLPDLSRLTALEHDRRRRCLVIVVLWMVMIRSLIRLVVGVQGSGVDSGTCLVVSRALIDNMFGGGKVDAKGSGPAFDKHVFDEEEEEEDVFAGVPVDNSPFDDLLVGIGGNNGVGAPSSKSFKEDDVDSFKKSAGDFDDLLPGFGVISPPTARHTADIATKRSSHVKEDPISGIDSPLAHEGLNSGTFIDPLEEISKLSENGNKMVDDSPVGVFDDVNPVDRYDKRRLSSRTGSSTSGRQVFRGVKSPEEFSVDSPGSSRKKAAQNNTSDSYQSVFGMPSNTNNSHSFGGQSGSPPPYEEYVPSERDSPSTTTRHNTELPDDIWLTVSEIPLFTQPTSAPPPSRPPPSRPARVRKAETGDQSSRTNVNDFPSFSNSSQHRQTFSRTSARSSVNELEDFVKGKAYAHSTVHDDVFDEHLQAQSDAAASAAAMKEAMNRAEAKFRHGIKENNYTSDDLEFIDHDQRRREEEEKQKLEQERMKAREVEKEREREEQWRHERERERAREEREKARQAVERTTREARERAATEARLRAKKTAVDKANLEARERAERLAVQRAQAEARERAAAEAKERAEKAAAEARARSNAEAKERADKAENEARIRSERTAVERAAKEVRERAAAQARERAAATRANQQKPEDDLETFFSSSSRPSSAPRTSANNMDSLFNSQYQTKQGTDDVRKTSSGSSSIRKTSSTTNIVDDLSSIFGGSPQSGGFREVETEERLKRDQRTNERAAKALAEKNERDLQAQREQAERHRFSETLDGEIKRWAAGKEGNLRALLSTMQYILWPECGWQPVSLTDLITGAAVKKVYRKATLCIHPDKVQQKGATLQQKYIAEKVFDLLKEAWNKFNSEELF
ncbi:hypothetical protein QQ045_019571 [Rhodiola kirilowii]